MNNTQIKGNDNLLKDIKLNINYFNLCEIM